MAIPVYRSTGAATGATDAGGAWTYSAPAANAVGNVIIFQALQDGSTGGAVALTGASNIENLAGTDNAWTSIGAFNVGNPTAAIQHLWIGRAINTSGFPSASGTNSTSEDLYMLMYEFSSVNTGTTLSDVIENGSAGSTPNGVGTSTTVSDTGVTTLGADRLALNCIATNDDNNFGPFTGETGGNWVPANSYFDASGTDGSVQIEQADMTSAGTIDGGTSTIVSSAWGVVGFALIGTTPAVTLPRPPTIVGSAVQRAANY